MSIDHLSVHGAGLIRAHFRAHHVGCRIGGSLIVKLAPGRDMATVHCDCGASRGYTALEMENLRVIAEAAAALASLAPVIVKP